MVAPAADRPLPLSAVGVAGLRVADEPERVAAEAAHVAGDHGQRGVRGDRRVHGAAAGAQDAEAGLAGQVVRAGHGAAATARDHGGHDGRLAICHVGRLATAARRRTCEGPSRP